MSSGQERYYTELAQSYYTGSGEPPGRWFGKAAECLGFEGIVEAKQLNNAMHGFSRDGLTPLVRNAGSAKRRPGFDLTFGAPKSVSVLWGLFPELRRALEAAHQKAVIKSLGYLQNEAAFTRMGAGGQQSQRADLMVAMFEHGSARPTKGAAADPHLHTHCLVINTCLGAEDGMTRTLDARHLFRHKMTAGVLYRAELFAQIRQHLGLTASRGEKWCELDVVSEDLRKLFSKRRNDIETLLEELGVSGAKESAQATLRTRSGKTESNREVLFQDWEQQVHESGLAMPVIEGLGEVLDSHSLLKAALPYGVEQLTDRKSFFTKRELIRAVAERVEEHGVGIEAICEAVEGAMGQLVDLGEHLGEQRFTTEEMLEIERSLKRTARGLWYRPNAIKEEVVNAVVAEMATMREEQEAALRHVTLGGSLTLVSGLAGTGKTFMLKAAREAWERSGRKVFGCALAAAAAKRLGEQSGIDCRSIHRTLQAIEKNRLRLDRNSVLVVDEAGMVGTRLMERLLSRVAEAGAKVVLAGDEKQLAAIEAGAPFRVFANELGGVHMVDIRRQDKQWARDAVRDFSEGKVRQAMARFVDQGLVFVDDDRAQVTERVVSDWREGCADVGMAETMILTGTREDARHMNQAVQRDRFQAGELGVDAVAVGGRAFFVGDRVLFRRNSMLVNNGDTGKVVAVSAEEGLLTVRLDGLLGQRVRVDLSTYKHVELGYAATTHAEQGATLGRCLVYCDSMMASLEATYVQASRAKTETRFYMDRATAGEGLTDIVRMMERSRQQEMATDLLYEGPVLERVMERAA